MFFFIFSTRRIITCEGNRNGATRIQHAPELSRAELAKATERLWLPRRRLPDRTVQEHNAAHTRKVQDGGQGKSRLPTYD